MMDTMPGVGSDAGDRYPRPGAHLTRDARRLAAQQTKVDGGWHPLSGVAGGPLRLLPEAGTCGDCLYLTRLFDGRRNTSNTKCAFRMTSGVASDCDPAWPGCERWTEVPNG